MNDSSDLPEEAYYRKPPRSSRPDQAIKSSRSSKQVRFEKARQKQQLVDQDDSRPQIPQSALRSSKKQKQYRVPDDSFDENPRRLDFRSATKQDFYKSNNIVQELQSQRSLQQQAFEPQYQSSRTSLQWQAKPTKEGFLYFFIPGTNTFQWQFPTFYDTKTGRKKHCFIENWTQKTDMQGQPYYYNKKSGLSQEVKPDSETYILQAAMLGNIAFTEIYIQVRGDLSIQDQRGRTCLHQAVMNGHKQLTQILCEFGHTTNLLEAVDKYGCTPLFSAIRYNQKHCLQVLLQYNCNLFHRNKKGDTCLHFAAQHAAEECIMILASFCGEQLLTTKNKDGLKAMEVAESLRNFSCANTLQVCERNIMYQNALLFRDQEEGKTSRSQRPRNPLMASSGGFQEQSPRRNPNVKTFEEDLYSEEEYGSEERDEYGVENGEYAHLDYESHIKKAYTQRNKERRAMLHEREYAQKTERDRRSERAQQNQPPKFVTKRPKQPRSARVLPPRPSYRDEEDYDEMDYRVRDQARQRWVKERYQLYPQEREEEPTYFEKAYDGISKVGSFFSQLTSRVTSRVVDYVYNETPRNRRHDEHQRQRDRSRSNSARVLPQIAANDEELGQYKTPRGGVHNQQRPRSAGPTNRFQTQEDSTYNSADDFRTAGQLEQSSGSSNYKTTYDRSRSRAPPQQYQHNQQQRSQQRQILLQQDDSSIMQPQTERTPQLDQLKFHNQKWQQMANEPQPERADRSKSPANQINQRPQTAQPKSILQQTKLQDEEASFVEMRSMCIQAQPPKRVRKNTNKTNISKHSIGVGSARIDETTMPLQSQMSESHAFQEQSTVENQKLSQSRLKKIKQISFGNQNTNLISKRYQSEESEQRRMEESKNYSPSPDPAYLKPQVFVRPAAQKPPTEQPQLIRRETFEPDQQPANMSIMSVQSRRSMRSMQKIAAPTGLTNEQFDIVNLNGEVNQQKAQYQLEEEIVKEFGQDHPPQKSPVPIAPKAKKEDVKIVPVINLNLPEPQTQLPKQELVSDEKIKSFFNPTRDSEKVKDFYQQLAHSVKGSSDSDEAVKTEMRPSTSTMHKVQPASTLSQCSPVKQAPPLLTIEFNPEEQDEENYQFHNENFKFFENSQNENEILRDLNEEHLTQVSDPSFCPQIQRRFGHQTQSVDRGHLNFSRQQSQYSIGPHQGNQGNNSMLKPLQMINQYPDSDCETKPSIRKRKTMLPFLPKKIDIRQSIPAQPKEVDLFSENSEKQRLSKPEFLINLQNQQPAQSSYKAQEDDDSFCFQGLQSPDQSAVENSAQQNKPVPKSEKSNSNKGSGGKAHNRLQQALQNNRQNAEPTEQEIRFDLTANETIQNDMTQNVVIEVAKNQDDSFNQEDDEFVQSQPNVIKQEVNSQGQRSKQSIKQDSISILFDGLEDATEPKIQPLETPTTQLKKPEEQKRQILGGYQSSGDEFTNLPQNRSAAFGTKRLSTNIMSSDDEGTGKVRYTRPENLSTLNTQKRQAKRSVKDVGKKKFKQDVEQATPEREQREQKEEKKSELSAADRLKASMANFARSKLSSEKDKNSSVASKFGQSRRSANIPPQTPDRK